jgi:hypothetical protein
VEFQWLLYQFRWGSRRGAQGSELASPVSSPGQALVFDQEMTRPRRNEDGVEGDLRPQAARLDHPCRSRLRRRSRPSERKGKTAGCLAPHLQTSAAMSTVHQQLQNEIE